MLYIMFDIIDVVQIQIYDNKSAYMYTVQFRQVFLISHTLLNTS